MIVFGWTEGCQEPHHDAQPGGRVVFETQELAKLVEGGLLVLLLIDGWAHFHLLGSGAGQDHVEVVAVGVPAVGCDFDVIAAVPFGVDADGVVVAGGDAEEGVLAELESAGVEAADGVAELGFFGVVAVALAIFLGHEKAEAGIGDRDCGAASVAHAGGEETDSLRRVEGGSEVDGDVDELALRGGFGFAVQLFVELGVNVFVS